MSTMEKQLDEKALKLKMLREELQILASDTLSQKQDGIQKPYPNLRSNDDNSASQVGRRIEKSDMTDDLRLSQTQKVEEFSITGRSAFDIRQAQVAQRHTRGDGSETPSEEIFKKNKLSSPANLRFTDGLKNSML